METFWIAELTSSRNMVSSFRLNYFDFLCYFRKGCDLTGQGALSLEAFVKGMWRIDEELRRMQLQATKTSSSTSLGSYRSNTHRPNTTQKSRDILR